MLNRLPGAIDTHRLDAYAAGLLAAVAVFAVYGPSTAGLFGVWFDGGNPTYNHGALLLAVAALLLFRNIRSGRVRLSPPPVALPLAATVTVGLGWCLAALVQVQVVEYIALVALLILAFYVLYGGGPRAGFLVPLALLFFALPFWEVAIDPLRQVTVYGTRALLAVTGVPVYFEGYQIHTAGGIFSVEPECSGLRQFIVAGAMGLMMGEYWLLAPRQRLVLFVSAIGVGIVSNFIRIYAIVLIGIHTSMQNPLVTDRHSTLGWIVFAVVFTGFVLAAARYFPVADSRPVTGSRPDAGRGRILKSAGLFLAAALIGPLLWWGLTARAAGVEVAVAEWPSRNGAWILTDAAAARWRPVALGADAVSAARYTAAGAAPVDIHRYHFVRQHRDKEAVRSGNRLYDERIWTAVSGRRHGVDSAGFEVVEQVLRSDVGRERLLWYWFDVAGHSVAGPVQAKLLQAWGMLTGREQVDIVAVSTPAPDVERARSRLTGFVRRKTDGR